MLFLDNNAEIRDLFREVEGVSQHGLDELFNQDVIEGNSSFADAIIQAGIVSREDLLNLISQYLGYELQIGEVGEIEQDALSYFLRKLHANMGLFLSIFQREAFIYWQLIRLTQPSLTI